MTGPMNAARGEPVPGVASIAVLRPNQVGDFMFALPALAALRETYPAARIVYLGRAWHKEFLESRTPLIDEVVVLPPIPGVGAPPDAVVDEDAIESACEALQRRNFDIAFQFYGGGRHSNPFVRRLGARLTVGVRAGDAEPLDRWLPYVPWHNERLRLLETVGLAGARPVDLQPLLRVLPRDRAELAKRLRLPADRPLLVLSPGATDPRRIWPVEKFAAVADEFVRMGACVVVQGGGPDDRRLTASVIAAMSEPAIDCGGLLTLGGLAALLHRARLVIASDSGPLQMAQAVGTPAVGIYWFVNLLVSGPLTSYQNRCAASLRRACPVCGQDNLTQRCKHDPSFVDDVSIEEVRALALELWNFGEAASSQSRLPAILR